MRRGMAFLLGAAAAAASGCATKDAAQVEVRSIGDRTAKLGVGNEKLAIARGQLALGNIGLAIEGYRAALREQPQNTEAMRGLANCYDHMGRVDLSRQYYEMALAVAPHSEVVLSAFAGSLEAQGKWDQALALRSEAGESVGQVAPAMPQSALAGTPGASVTVALPPARVAVAIAPTPPAIEPRSEVVRLERLSPREVALVTAGQPIWQPRIVARTAQNVTVRWTPLGQRAGRPNIRLLNAARNQGLAARTRNYLANRGWRNIEIGDADAVLASSVVMYPAGRQATGHNLAGQFGFRPGIKQQGDAIVVLLGRDAAAGRNTQVRG
ncbi:tetratricopeptide (TPR) repeat protein [Sphingomonas sp. F9_3S_D5_B_2]